MTYLKRRRIAGRDAKEAAGESFWTDEFSQATRNKILYQINDFCRNERIFTIQAQATIIRSEGLNSLNGKPNNPHDDFISYANYCENDEFPVVIEEIFNSLGNYHLAAQVGFYPNVEEYSQTIASILIEDRINYDFINGIMLPRENQAIHASVILPTLQLLGSEPKWAELEKSYLKGLSEISSSDPADAITDFGSALENFLTAIECEGDTLGRLISDGVGKNLITSKDRKLFDWVASERNSGEAHGGGGTENLDDAWLVANVVGSLILRWSKETAR